MLKIQSLLESIDTIKRTTPDEQLGSILRLSSSSHDPVFIFDEHDNFVGLVSPYLALYHRRAPYTTNVSSVYIVPPALDIHTDILSVVNHMLSTRLYTLPVFDDKKKIVGVIRAQRIFSHIGSSEELLEAVSQQLVVKKPYLIHDSLLVKDVYQKLRQKHTTRLVVVDEKKKIVGILTRNDLKMVFLSPSPRQRFSKSFGDVGQNMYDEEKIKRNDLPIKKYIKINVLSERNTSTLSNVMKKLVKSKRNSIVLVNNAQHPVGLLSHRDLLLGIAKLGNEKEIPIVMEKPQYVSESTIPEIRRMLSEMGEKINTLLPLKRIEISFKEGRNDAGKPTLIESTLKALFYTRDNFVATVSNRNILIAVKESLRRIHKMVRRSSDKQKKKHA